ncbi:MAG: hypothetical protein BWY87_00671 [Deltaproteobacteria bacterium ADurb.Bin510]|nr:MAG: hypothetical protein BWY87_00671 [Deltaproteobacteria bacterium ADurb.Bin510]
MGPPAEAGHIAPGAGQGLPGQAILLVADPDREVVVDPGTGGQRRDGRRGRGRRIAEAPRPDRGVSAQSLVDAAQKAFTAIAVVLPGVLAVQNHADKAALLAAQLLETPHEIRHGFMRLVLGIDKANRVRESAVAEEHLELCRTMAHRIGPVERNRAAGLLERIEQDVLVAQAEIEAVTRQQVDEFGADRAFGRPDSGRSLPENPLVQFDGLDQLGLEILGVGKGLGRQLHLAATQGVAHVHDERRDRMIEG